MSAFGSLLYYLFTTLGIILVYIAFNLSDIDLVVLFFLAFAFIPVDVTVSGFYDDYLSQRNTMVINGFFTGSIFFTHFRGYIRSRLNSMRFYPLISGIAHQLVVAPFLFFSGYGVMEQIQKGGMKYIHSIISYRIPTLYIKYLLALFLFYLQTRYYGEEVSTRNTFLTLIFWKTFGNSNWYLFVIFSMYFGTYIIFTAFFSYSSRVCGFSLLIYVYIEYGILKYLRRSRTYFYDTFFCYPSGVLFSLYKKQITSIITHSNRSWIVSLGLIMGFFIESYYYAFCRKGTYTLFWYQCVNISFVLVIIVLMMKVRFRNKALAYLGGSRLFGHYLLQRLPMRQLQYSFQHQLASVYFLVSVCITIALSYIYEYVCNLIIKRMRAAFIK